MIRDCAVPGDGSAQIVVVSVPDHGACDIEIELLERVSPVTMAVAPRLMGGGEIWTRPGLDRKTRSIINIAMLTALNRPHEVRLHVRGALNNGLTREEIKEVLLQAAIYCGVPAALDSFRIAAEVLKEEDAKRT